MLVVPIGHHGSVTMSLLSRLTAGYASDSLYEPTGATDGEKQREDDQRGGGIPGMGSWDGEIPRDPRESKGQDHHT